MKTKSLYPIIVVEDLDATLKFYTEILDFTVKHDLVRKDGGHVIVIANEAGQQMEVMEQFKAGPQKFPLGIYGFRMNVDDIEAAKEELIAKGYEVPNDIFSTDVGQNLFITDPSGVHITLIKHVKK